MESRTRSTTVADPRTSLALWLRAGRAQRKLTIDDVARVTKIQPRILEKLETGQLEGLPAEVFVRGFVKSFARCVGLDESEAAERYGACAGADATPATSAARAFVETLVAAPARAPRTAAGTPPEPTPVVAALPVEEIAPVEEISPEPSAPVIEIVAAPVAEIENVVAPVAEIAPVVVEAAPVETIPAVEAPKKKRSRRKADGSTPPRTRKKKNAKPANASHGEISEGLAIELASASGEMAANAVASAEIAPAEMIVAPTESAPADVVAAPNVASTASAATEIASTETTSTQIASTIEAPSEIAATVSAPIEVVDHTAEPQPVWQPTMPPIATTPMVPWKRPTLHTSTYVVPTLVIDDADPELADREREEREAARAPSRVSFLPPILLERDDKSGRQGGLTLAVILLLIAATLTLSYLMRRPGATGDGVTMMQIDTPAKIA